MATTPTPLNVLLFKEEGFWVAQCLQFDIASQGKSINEATSSFERVLVAQIICDLQEGRTPLDGVPQAPQECFEKFKRFLFCFANPGTDT